MLKQGAYDVEYAEIRGRGKSGKSGRPISTSPAPRVIPISDMYRQGYSEPKDSLSDKYKDDYFTSGGGGAFTSYNHYDTNGTSGSTRSVYKSHVRKVKTTSSSYTPNGMFENEDGLFGVLLTSVFLKNVTNI